MRGTRGRPIFARNIDQAGMADLLIFMPGQRCLHIELKRVGGKLSPEQKKWQETCARSGQRYEVVFHVRELEKIMCGYGFIL